MVDTVLITNDLRESALAAAQEAISERWRGMSDAEMLGSGTVKELAKKHARTWRERLRDDAMEPIKKAFLHARDTEALWKDLEKEYLRVKRADALTVPKQLTRVGVIAALRAVGMGEQLGLEESESPAKGKNDVALIKAIHAVMTKARERYDVDSASVSTDDVIAAMDSIIQVFGPIITKGDTRPLLELYRQVEPRRGNILAALQYEGVKSACESYQIEPTARRGR